MEQRVITDQTEVDSKTGRGDIIKRELFFVLPSWSNIRLHYRSAAVLLQAVYCKNDCHPTLSQRKQPHINGLSKPNDTARETAAA